MKMGPSRGLIAILAAFMVFALAAGKVEVDVYYEALCPDSMNFIRRQLYPSYDKLKDHINVNFVPFGKASWNEGDPSQRTEFACQHGPPECQGNREMACAIYELQQSARSVDEQQKLAVEIVNCVMNYYQADSNIAQCSKKYNLSEDAILRIQTCANTKLGDNLLVSHGQKTHGLRPKVSFIPTIVLNGERSTSAFRDFFGAVCGQLPDANKPADCSR